MNASQMPRCDDDDCDRAAFYFDPDIPPFENRRRRYCQKHAYGGDRPMVGPPGYMHFGPPGYIPPNKASPS